MAISLGAAALAFAGGAATQYNKMADEERKAEAKRKERLQELVDQAMVKQEETKYSYEMSEHQKDLALAETLKSVRGGVRSAQGQLAIAERRGLDKTMFLKSGDFGYMTFDGPGKAPIPYTQRMMEYASSDYDPKKVKFAERYRQMHEGKTYTKDGAGILRGVDTDPTGRAAPIDVARGLGLSENDPAWLVGDPSNLDEEAYRRYMQDTARQLRGEKPEHQWITNPKTGAVSLATISPEGVGTITEMQAGIKPEKKYEYKEMEDGSWLQVDPTGKEDPKVVYKLKGGGFTGESPEGERIGDLLALRRAVAENPDDKLLAQALKEMEAEIAAQDFDESGQLFQHLETGDVIKPIIGNDGTYRHGDNIIDITQYKPVTDDTLTNKVTEQGRKISALKGRQAAIGNFQAGLDTYKQTVTDATKGGLTGVVLDISSSIGQAVLGTAELLGVDPVTPAQREELLSKAGVSIEDLISKDTGALRGFNKEQAETLVYLLGGILKEDADLARTGVADIQAAGRMIKNLSSVESGIGAFASLQHLVNIKKAGVFQEMYQTQGATPKDRAMAGTNLFRLYIAKNDQEWEKVKGNVKYHPTTGEVYINRGGKAGLMSLDQLIMQEGDAGNLRPSIGIRPR